MTSATSMSLNVDNNSGTRIDMEGGGGSGVIHGVPPPPPVPPSPLVPSVAQGMGDPTGGEPMEGGTCLGPILFPSPKRSFSILFRRIFNLFPGVPTPTGV